MTRNKTQLSTIEWKPIVKTKQQSAKSKKVYADDIITSTQPSLIKLQILLNACIIIT